MERLGMTLKILAIHDAAGPSYLLTRSTGGVVCGYFFARRA